VRYNRASGGAVGQFRPQGLYVSSTEHWAFKRRHLESPMKSERWMLSQPWGPEAAEWTVDD